MDSDTDNDISPENTDDEQSNEEVNDDDLSAEMLAKLNDNNFEENSDDEDTETRVNGDQFEKIVPELNKRILHLLELTDKYICRIAFRPLYQDVTPSFADEVPFLVDGDSLMITLMMDKNWSNQLGGSSLHLVYLFERYLNIFIQRGGTFHLVFFQNWRNIWNSNWNILLHRSIIINHFSKNAQKYPVHIFKHCFDEDFANLVSILRPGFMLTNMNAYENCADFFKIKKVLLKHIMNVNLINWLKMDLPCIGTNSIEVDVSIVRGFYLECNTEVKKITINHFNKLIHFITTLPEIEDCMDIPDFIKINLKYDIRKATFLTAAFFYYKRNQNENMVKIFFLTCAIMEFLKLKNRCCPKFTTPLEDLDGIINEWHKFMFFALSALENEDYNYTVVSDMWHGILFGHVCRFALSKLDKSETLGSEVSSIYENMVQDFNKFGYSEKFLINPYPIELNSDTKFQAIHFITSDQKDHKPLIPIKNQLNFSFCGDILNNIKWCNPPKKFKKKQYTEEHHYHSMKVITDEHDHIKDGIQKRPTNEWELKWFLNSRNLQAKYMTLYGSSIEGRPLKTSAIIRNAKNPSNKKEKQSKKKKELLEAKMKNDLLVQQKKDKEKYENLKTQYKNYHGDLDKFLNQIDLVLGNKLFYEGSYKIETLFLKLKVLRTILKDKSHIRDKKIENEKSIFLIAREILNSGCDITDKNKVILSKCLSDINCTEIAKRNKLVIQNEPAPEDDAWIRFQLEHLGPDLIRETGGKPDSRVSDFIPDPWQRELFDIVDKRQSALIVAPTSSGKTYASYYCMESVLREGTEGIIVYVAPTKALVNQVAATVYARFKDTKMPDGMSVYGIFTRDYRMYALNSQILVTVPQCLEILLLSPRRHSWVKRIRYIIFDEIHCIEGVNGAAFERCLLLIRCPFLALSATIRNPEGFHEWMQRAENYKHDRDVADGNLREENSYKVHLVEHSERHSDLTKFTYGNGRLHHLHPYAELEASVIVKNKGIPSHMTLSPAETIQLYNTMRTTFPNCENLIQLSPIIFFSSFPENGFISRNLVRQYASELSTVLIHWFYNYPQYFEDTIKSLKPTEVDEIGGTGRLYIKDNIVDFVLHLKEQNLLPAIIFAYSRTMIRDMTVATTKYFEINKKKNSSRTVGTNNRKENICVMKPVEDRLENKKYKAKALQSYSGNAEKSLESISSNMAYIDRRNLKRSIKYEKPLYLISEDASQTLQGIGVMDAEDIKFVEERLRKAYINSNDLISKSMRNGLCMHHGGLNNKVRGAVEMLFRKKFLNVVFATGTLALGIHMPCKTTVIAGNSAWLNSLEYHQMSGRAGRRGYDTAGNVIFLGMNPRKQHSLLTAKLPSLKGNFPITVSLILRTLLLVSDVTEKGKQSEEATKISVSRVLTMLENSLCFMENPDLKINIKHFFSFTLQLLKIQEFINENGEPLKWCGLGTRLHYHEPGNLAFVYLLRTGVIRKICSEKKSDEDIHFKLLTILNYLFTSIPLDAASKQETYNSKVILDPLPEIVSEALTQYNTEVRFVFEQYFANVATYFDEEDNKLPLSSVKIVGNCSSTEDEQSLNIENLQNNFLNMCTPQVICSSFAALSGNNDSNAYTEDTLISNLKQKMGSDVKVIPLVNLEAELNGYAVDFYRHQSVKSIIHDNGIREGAEFTLLTDFLLVLKTICVMLEEMKVKTETDCVYRQFKLLENKYSGYHAKAFGRVHM